MATVSSVSTKTSIGDVANRQIGNVMAESEAMLVDKAQDRAARL